MIKRVNGKSIDIDNFDLFDIAAEDEAKHRVASNDVMNIGNMSFGIIENCINLYNLFYRYLPYPIYNIDSPIKYATIGNYLDLNIKSNNVHIWVDDGLWVCIDEENSIAIQFINNTWGLQKIDGIKASNLDFSIYEDEVGFSEFVWVFNRVVSGNGTGSFYNEFMPKFVKACNAQPLILRWELLNILNFDTVPNKIYLPVNNIIDLDSGRKYIIDTYISGKINTGKQTLVLDFSGNQNSKFKEKVIDDYNCVVYNTGGEKEQMRRVSLPGIETMFVSLNRVRLEDESDKFSAFRAFIADDHIVYSIDGKLFITSLYDYTEPIEVAGGVEIYSYYDGTVYFYHRKKLGYGAYKEYIYSYKLNGENNEVKLCKVRFVTDVKS